MEPDHFPMKNPHLTARPFPICDNLPENWHLKSFNLFLWVQLLNLVFSYLPLSIFNCFKSSAKKQLLLVRFAGAYGGLDAHRIV